MVDGSPSVCLRECTQVCGSAFHTCYPPWWRDHFFEIAYTSTTPCPTELYEIVWAIQLYSSYTAYTAYTSLYIAIHNTALYSVYTAYTLYITVHSPSGSACFRRNIRRREILYESSKISDQQLFNLGVNHDYQLSEGGVNHGMINP